MSGADEPVTGMQRAFGLALPETLAAACDPRRTALLVYDMQAGVVAQLADGAEIARRVALVVEAARLGLYRIVYTRHLSLPNELAGVTQLRMAMSWQRARRAQDVKPAFLRASPAFALSAEFEPRPSEAIFDKITMSAFAGTPLDIALRDCGINSFVVAGIALEIGIEPTVRHALDLGYIPIVVTDACGSREKTAAARALAGFEFAGGSFQTDVATICALLRRGAAPGDA